MIHLDDLLSAHLDGELAADETERVVDHLYECAQCRRELEELTEIRAVVRSLPELEPPIPLLPAARRSKPWTAAVASVAAAVVAIGIVITPSEATPLELDTMAGQHAARVVVDPGISTIRGPLGGR